MGLGYCWLLNPPLKAATMPIVGIALTHGTLQRTCIACPTSRDNRVRKDFAAKLDIRLGKHKGGLTERQEVCWGRGRGPKDKGEGGADASKNE